MQAGIRFDRGMILAAFQVEVEQVAVKLTKKATMKKEGLLNCLTGRYGFRELLVGYTGMGKVNAAAATQRAIDLFQPDFLIFCGTAGALDQRLRPLDLVVAETLLQHDTGPEEPLRIETDAWIRAGLLEAGRSALEGGGVVHGGTLLTGDQPVLELKSRQKLHKRFQAVAVDMEAAAAVLVAQQHGLPAGVVKAITDSADRNGIKDFKKNVKQGAALAQRAVGSFLAHYI